LSGLGFESNYKHDDDAKDKWDNVIKKNALLQSNLHNFIKAVF
jgi:hypothetical protein